MTEKKYHYFLLVFCFVFFSFNLKSQTYIKQIHSKKAHNYGLQGSLNLLNLCGEQPENIQEIFKVAFNKLSTNSKFSFNDLANDSEFREICKKNGIIHTGGPMLGNISSEGVNIWIRTLYPANIEVTVEGDGSINKFGPVKSTEFSDLTAIVKVSGLKPDTKYNYKVLLDNQPLKLDIETYFTTLPLENKSDKTIITFGSCYHRWGLCNYKLAEQIISRNPQAMIINGDIAAQDRNNNIAMHRADYLLRDFQMAWQNFSAIMPVYTTWDDHDYFHDDGYNVPEGYIIEDKEAVSEIFRISWNNPEYGSGEKGKGVYFKTRIGLADVIMLDNRYFRKKGNFLGDEQMEWLEKQLLECKGPFIILSCGTMFNDYVSNGKDSWGKFDPEGREKIFNFIEKHKIGGVLLISGDRHGARGFTIPRPSGFNFYEFGAASLGGRVGEPPIRADWNTQLYGIAGEYAFGEFTFSNTVPDPEVIFRLIHESGTIFYELKLKRSELTPK